MEGLTIYNNPAFGDIRGTMKEGEPWIVGKDVATALGYKDTSDALKKHVDVEYKLTRRFADSGQNREMYIINESGLYSLILSSKLPTAKEFKRWVTSEVLPSIRKTGGYIVGQETLSDADLMAKALLVANRQLEERAKRVAELEGKNGELTERVAVQNQQLAEMRPKAGYYDVILSCSGSVPTTVVAKDYGWSAKRLNDFLHNKRVQYKVNGTWVLYTKYAQQGYTDTETYPYTGSDGKKHSRVFTRWTQKGRLFIYELMKASGNLPLVEKDGADESAE